ncbi:hypothetical protein O181_023322 [Austropuccinia psidii MF-1]|uniref:Uncharacterized protein n=1 Tax=Austropuccinia psidii MF-1 TaxID=1389203 RepID=A0A9Q3CH67_9BASI|nr:hypothetical protein [Austropuccinia psidii MF-1]
MVLLSIVSTIPAFPLLGIFGGKSQAGRLLQENHNSALSAEFPLTPDPTLMGYDTNQDINTSAIGNHSKPFNYDPLISENFNFYLSPPDSPAVDSFQNELQKVVNSCLHRPTLEHGPQLSFLEEPEAVFEIENIRSANAINNLERPQPLGSSGASQDFQASSIINQDQLKYLRRHFKSENDHQNNFGVYARIVILMKLPMMFTLQKTLRPSARGDGISLIDYAKVLELMFKKLSFQMGISKTLDTDQKLMRQNYQKLFVGTAILNFRILKIFSSSDVDAIADELGEFQEYLSKQFELLLHPYPNIDQEVLRLDSNFIERILEYVCAKNDETFCSIRHRKENSQPEAHIKIKTVEVLAARLSVTLIGAYYRGKRQEKFDLFFDSTEDFMGFLSKAWLHEYSCTQWYWKKQINKWAKNHPILPWKNSISQGAALKLKAIFTYEDKTVIRRENM